MRVEKTLIQTLINSHATLVLLWTGHESWESSNANSRFSTLTLVWLGNIPLSFVHRLAMQPFFMLCFRDSSFGTCVVSVSRGNVSPRNRHRTVARIDCTFYVAPRITLSFPLTFLIPLLFSHFSRFFTSAAIRTTSLICCASSWPLFILWNSINHARTPSTHLDHGCCLIPVQVVFVSGFFVCRWLCQGQSSTVCILSPNAPPSRFFNF